jgi:Zn-dependent peptidase ImmA (M78 family)/transcriptional regulator with XRE-family HTH domain
LDAPQHLTVKLKQARLATGDSTRKVAEKLKKWVKVSHTTLTNYEAGRSQPTMEVLAALAKLYDRPLNWFLSHALTLRNVRYRNRKSRVKLSDLARYEAHAIKWLQAYRSLEDTLGQPLRGDLAGFRFKDEESGSDAARRLRAKMNLDDDEKITSVADLLERLGVRAIELPTVLAVDGLAALAVGEDEEYVVALNSTVSSDRARLNAAHEVGHVLAGDCDSDDIDNRGPNEDRAFEFASYLLLTDEMLRVAFAEKSMVRLVQFKERFGISVAAMIYRAKNLRLISETVAKRIWIEISRRGWKQNEPGYVAEDRSVRFERLLDAALLEEKLTMDQAAELSGVRSDELRERHEWALGLVAWRSDPYVKTHDQEQPHLRLVY